MLPDTLIAVDPIQPEPAAAPYGVASINEPIALDAKQFELIADGIRQLWQRIELNAEGPVEHPLLLSYDVHLTHAGPVLIEVNTNAGGVLAAFDSAHWVNDCCADAEQFILRQRLLELLRRDLVKPGERLAIVDEDLASQPLLAEMHALATMLREDGISVDVVDSSQLQWQDGQLSDAGGVIDAIYWRSTDFELDTPNNAAIRMALDAGAVRLAPSPSTWRAIADKRLFIGWSKQPVLAEDEARKQTFRVAKTVAMNTLSTEDWYSDRAAWVFKPYSGHAGKGVVLGRKISRARINSLPINNYLAQEFVAHPTLERGGETWKYDLRFFADRDQIIGAAARVFRGQVVNMREPGSGFAPLRVDGRCCLVGAIAASGPQT